jgi:hypothetical protein
MQYEGGSGKKPTQGAEFISFFSGGATARDLLLTLFSGIGQGLVFIRSSTLPTLPLPLWTL